MLGPLCFPGSNYMTSKKPETENIATKHLSRTQAEMGWDTDYIGWPGRGRE